MVFDIDIKQPREGVELSGEGLVNGPGYLQYTSAQVLSEPTTPKMVPVGLFSPPNWNSGPDIFGQVGWGADDDQYTILPGQNLNGFQITSRGLPGIRDFRIEPDLMPPSEESDITIEQIQEVEDKVAFFGKTIGPTAPPRDMDFKAFLEAIRSYINESVTLGWLIDPTLTNTLKTYLDTTGAYIDANDPTQAKAVLQEFMSTIEQASSNQRTPEAQALLYFNAKYLKDTLPDTYIPPVLKLDLTPSEVALAIGTVHTITATYTEDNIPVPLSPRCQVTLKVTTGPNAGIAFTEPTDDNGNAIFSYTSSLVGIDRLEAEIPEIPDFCMAVTSIPIQVVWNGGPDLTIPLFFPPLIKKSEGEKTIFVKDITSNTGNTSSAPSITRYFLSDVEPIDIATALDIGEREVPGLEPGQEDESDSQTLTLPSDMPAGTYYLAACADPDDAVVELDEGNNCSFAQIQTIFVPIEKPSNQPPDCTKATATPDRLWPPNHRLVSISISGITDPDGDPVSITITRITQDEPVNGLGDGDTSPDGFGVGSSQAQVRAERSGIGNGRVYQITFTADDGKGGSCQWSVQVSVPHDKGQGATPIDDGQNYNSTLP